MSEPEKTKPKRRYRQIHLSTAIILLLIAGREVGWLVQIFTYYYVPENMPQEEAPLVFKTTAVLLAVISLVTTYFAVEHLNRRREGRNT